MSVILHPTAECALNYRLDRLTTERETESSSSNALLKKCISIGEEFVYCLVHPSCKTEPYVCYQHVAKYNMFILLRSTSLRLRLELGNASPLAFAVVPVGKASTAVIVNASYCLVARGFPTCTGRLFAGDQRCVAFVARAIPSNATF